jgi:ferredoxin
MQNNKKFKIQVVNRNTEFLCKQEDNLLVGMEKRQVNDVTVGCRCGGCGVCKIKVHAGNFTSKRMSKAHISEEDLHENIVLACRIFPDSDLKISAEKVEFCNKKT